MVPDPMVRSCSDINRQHYIVFKGNVAYKYTSFISSYLMKHPVAADDIKKKNTIQSDNNGIG